ncbi:hypothetical protein AYJ57_20985 (plasmid) [Salipiger sp. CCB-MM3]|nr:hypothetical protein AYJ57_20985 [Salipiger sp. CCB-MM3]
MLTCAHIELTCAQVRIGWSTFFRSQNRFSLGLEAVCRDVAFYCIYDLEDDSDGAEIARIYGNRTTWRVLEPKVAGPPSQGVL